MLPRCDTSSSPVLHNARAIQFHRVHPSSFPTGRPATGLCTQTLADRKASLTPITLEWACVCGGSLVSAPLAVNQFLPGYRLSAPRSLSYYSAAVCSSAGPVWTGAARPHGYVVTTPTPAALILQLPPHPHLAWPFLSPNSAWRRSSAAGVSNFLLLGLLSVPFLVDETLNSLFLHCSTTSHALIFSLLNTRRPRLFSFSVVGFGSFLSLCRPPKLVHSPCLQTILLFLFPIF